MSEQITKTRDGETLTDVKSIRVKNCINCINFKETGEVCTKYNARPPARTIAQGCEAHEFDIPFQLKNSLHSIQVCLILIKTDQSLSGDCYTLKHIHPLTPTVIFTLID